MGHVVGADGTVDAIEVDGTLAARARLALSPWPWVTVHEGDGTRPGAAYDAVLINCGLTHPVGSWLDALSLDGRMVLPLTVALPPGSPIGKGVAMAIRRTESEFAARVISMVAIYNAVGLRQDSRRC